MNVLRLAPVLISTLFLSAHFFRARNFPLLAVAVGVYLPFELSVPIFVGGLIHFLASRILAKSKGASKDASGGGLLFASGLITGEALMGITLAIPVVLLKQYDIKLPLWEMPFGTILGIVLLALVAMRLYKLASGRILSST